MDRNVGSPDTTPPTKRIHLVQDDRKRCTFPCILMFNKNGTVSPQCILANLTSVHCPIFFEHEYASFRGDTCGQKWTQEGVRSVWFTNSECQQSSLSLWSASRSSSTFHWILERYSCVRKQNRPVRYGVHWIVLVESFPTSGGSSLCDFPSLVASQSSFAMEFCRNGQKCRQS